jgi:uncharacterized protein (DUF58 family)
MRFTVRFLLLISLSPIGAGLGLLEERFLLFSWIWAALLIMGSLVDWVMAQRTPMDVQRFLPHSFTQGIPAIVEFRIRNFASHTVRIEIIDQAPTEFFPLPEKLETELHKNSSTTLNYETQSNERGEFFWKPFYFCTTGRLGLARCIRKLGPLSSIKVFPRLRIESGVQFEVARRRQALLGQRWIRRLGEGREFESLRTYTRDDDYRWIDWKSVAKQGRLIVRQYQAERNQRLLILLDCGRFMLSKVGKLTKLDFAVEAAMSLTRSALQHGDQVGILVFDSEIRGWIAPHRNVQLLSQMSDLLRKVKGQRLESDYRLACAQAAKRSSRRTLMVCFTEVHEHATLLARSLSSLYPRHLPVCVTMADADLYRESRKVPKTPQEAFEVVAANEVWDHYQQTLTMLQGWKVLTVNALADTYCSAILNRYADIKSRGIL